MAQKLEKIGYAQCEPNKISAQRTKEIFSMLPLANDVTVCEQGMVMIYDDLEGKVRFPKEEEDANALFGLVYSEIVLEDERKQEDKDFAIINFPESAHQRAMNGYPRLFGFTKGDLFNTNAIITTDGKTLPAAKALYKAGTDGYWTPVDTPADLDTIVGPIVAVKKQYTLPDGQLSVQFVVVRA